MRQILMLIPAVVLTGGWAQERTPQWLFEHGHIGEARAVAQQRIAANPRDGVALAWLARTETVGGDLERAVATAERAMAADPGYVGAHLSLAEALGEQAERAGVFRQLALARRIRRTLEGALASHPSSIDALEGMMQFYLRAPGIVGGSGAKAEAMSARIGGLDAARGFLAQAAIASHRKQPDRVETLFLKALGVNRNSVHAREALAGFYVERTEKQAEAETHARALLELDAALLTPYRVLARVYARARRWDELDAILARADTQHPANLVAWLEAGQVLRETGADRARAERCLRRYLSQPPEIGMPSHALAQGELRRLQPRL